MKTTFALVHGAWHGAWCWSAITQALEHAGYRAMAFDLPAHGQDTTPIHTVTLARYADAILAAVGPQREPLVLVSHSMGGPAMLAIESAPDRFAAVAYVAGVIPPHGSPMMSLVNEYDPSFLATFERGGHGRSVRISEQGAREFLYPLSPRTVADAAVGLLCAEPVAPFEEPIRVTAAGALRVPAYYIETLRDRAVPIGLQRKIQLASQWKRVLAISSDHSPFFSAPRTLLDALIAVAETL